MRPYTTVATEWEQATRGMYMYAAVHGESNDELETRQKELTKEMLKFGFVDELRLLNREFVFYEEALNFKFKES